MIHKSYQMVALRPSPPIRRPSALKPKKPNVGFKSVGVIVDYDKHDKRGTPDSWIDANVFKIKRTSNHVLHRFHRKRLRGPWKSKQSPEIIKWMWEFGMEVPPPPPPQLLARSPKTILGVPAFAGR